MNVGEHSRLADRVIADVFEQFPELLAVAIIRDQHVELPRGSTRLAGGDQLLIVASGTASVDAFSQLASAGKFQETT